MRTLVTLHVGSHKDRNAHSTHEAHRASDTNDPFKVTTQILLLTAGFTSRLTLNPPPRFSQTATVAYLFEFLMAQDVKFDRFGIACMSIQHTWEFVVR